MRGVHPEEGKVDPRAYFQEKGILESVERGEWRRIRDLDKEAKRDQECASEHRYD